MSRIRANLDALETLHALGEGPATPAQQTILAGWSSWGATPSLFDPSKHDMVGLRDRAQQLLGTTAAWNAAARTTINAHYTDHRIAEVMWRMLTDLGLPADARVLEPGCGSGNFIGHAPVGSDMVGVEVDQTTAAIARKLYPRRAQIRAESFADTKGIGSFDAVIGNVPFADVTLHDRAYNRGRHSMHNHFLIKSLAMTNPGGVVALLTSRYTLDAQDATARMEMAELGELLGAIRLPEGSHRRTAGTDAVTDLLVFRRHGAAAEPGTPRPDWVGTHEVEIDGVRVHLNNTFRHHPEWVLGRLSTHNSQYGQALTVKPTDLDALPDQLARQLSDIAATAAATSKGWQPYRNQSSARLGGAPDAFIGHIRATELGGFEEATESGYQDFHVPGTQADELRLLLTMRDQYLTLIAAEAASSVDTAEHRELRADLNDTYDHYVARYGPINRFTQTPGRPRRGFDEAAIVRRQPPAVMKFRRDPHAVYVAALEVFDETNQTAAKAAILRSRVLTAREPRERADSAEDALALCLDRRGHVDVDTIAGLLGIDATGVPEQLADLVYAEPGSGQLIPAAQYLSGPVRTKLEAAQAAAEADPDRYRRNVEALRRVQPADLQPGEIRARLGAVWIPASDVHAFVTGLFGEDRVEVSKDVRGWKVTGGNRSTVQALSEWGTDRMPGQEIIQHLLNQTPIRIWDHDLDDNAVPNPAASTAAREKGTQIQARFDEWIWQDPSRARRLAADYNRRFNGTVVRRDYLDGRTLDLPGMARNFRPKDYQLNAVARVLQEGSAGIFHPVGFGKTAIMVIAAMEQKRLGLVNKPALVVPNHMLDQAQRDWLQIYPGARIVAASSADLTRDRRRALVAKITNGDWDGVIMTRSAFSRLPVSAEQMERYLNDQVQPMRQAFEAEIASAGENSPSVKRAQKQLLKLEERIKDKLDSVRDVGVTFEQTGIDFVMADELHEFKNLDTPSKIPGGGISNGSMRATDLHQKISYLRDKHGGRAILGATATPISNSVAEVYVMLRHLQPGLLTDAGISTFDEWAATFGEVTTSIELAPGGGSWRETSRFARFTNVPELLQMWASVGDTLNLDEVTVDRPELIERPEDGKRTPIVVKVPNSDQLDELTRQLGDRVEQIRNRGVEPEVDNMLKVTSEGRLAALDLRLTPQYRGYGDLELTVSTKAEAAAREIHRIWQQNRDHTYLDPVTGQPHPRPGALQLVFCDLGTPKPPKAGVIAAYNVYDDLKSQLIAAGLPASQIRFMHEASNDTEKARLFEQARTGEVAVLIGSTAKMGVGTNVQARAIALHHLDCTWKPAEIEQREGRIVRQGNQNPEVQIYRYATEKSFDAYMWQTVGRKGRFIDQVMSGRIGERDIEDIASEETISYEEMQALITGNPYLREKHEIDSEITRLQMLQRQHQTAQQSLQRTISHTEQEIQRLETIRIPGLQEATTRTRPTKGDDFTVVIAGRRYDKRADAAPALTRAAQSFLGSAGSATTQAIGHLGGHDLSVSRDLLSDGGVKIRLSEHLSPVSLSRDELTAPTPSYLVRLENAIGQLPHQLQLARDKVDEHRDQLQRARGRLGEPFAQRDQLEALYERRTEINQAIAELTKTKDEPTSGAEAASRQPAQAAAAQTIGQPGTDTPVDGLAAAELAEFREATAARDTFLGGNSGPSISPSTGPAPGAPGRAEPRLDPYRRGI